MSRTVFRGIQHSFSMNRSYVNGNVYMPFTACLLADYIAVYSDDYIEAP